MAMHHPAVPTMGIRGVHRLIIVRRDAGELYDELCTRWQHDPGTVVIFDRRRTRRLSSVAGGRRYSNNADVLRQRGYYVQRLVIGSSARSLA